jgi:hypothetical protein
MHSSILVSFLYIAVASNRKHLQQASCDFAAHTDLAIL